MAPRNKFGGTKGFRKLGGGASIGALRQIVFMCEGCGLGSATRDPCKGCGRMDFVRFDSRAEWTRNGELELLQKAGKISELRRQQRFALNAYRLENPAGDLRIPAAVKVGEYVADFTYRRDGALVVEDVKGSAMTDLAEWKLRHFSAQYGFDVKLTKG